MAKSPVSRRGASVLVDEARDASRSVDEWTKFDKPTLVLKCNYYRVDAVGTKAVLSERLVNYFKSKVPPASSPHDGEHAADAGSGLEDGVNRDDPPASDNEAPGPSSKGAPGPNDSPAGSPRSSGSERSRSFTPGPEEDYEDPYDFDHPVYEPPPTSVSDSDRESPETGDDRLSLGEYSAFGSSGSDSDAPSKRKRKRVRKNKRQPKQLATTAADRNPPVATAPPNVAPLAPPAATVTVVPTPNTAPGELQQAQAEIRALRSALGHAKQTISISANSNQRNHVSVNSTGAGIPDPGNAGQTERGRKRSRISTKGARRSARGGSRPRTTPCRSSQNSRQQHGLGGNLPQLQALQPPLPGIPYLPPGTVLPPAPYPVQLPTSRHNFQQQGLSQTSTQASPQFSSVS